MLVTYLFYNKTDGVFFLPSTQRDDIDFWPFWCFLITGPVLFINLIIYLITGRILTGIIVSCGHGLGTRLDWCRHAHLCSSLQRSQTIGLTLHGLMLATTI